MITKMYEIHPLQADPHYLQVTKNRNGQPLQTQYHVPCRHTGEARSLQHAYPRNAGIDERTREHGTPFETKRSTPANETTSATHLGDQPIAYERTPSIELEEPYPRRNPQNITIPDTHTKQVIISQGDLTESRRKRAKIVSALPE